ncbi:MAG: type VI secretion system needle protein Hcp [Tannerella sp.]|jgi:hypothetical protein|nr:type VI secretion system needle protein Hcp [Tannerella sp.]
MAFRSKLSFEGKEYDVLDCNYSFRRDVDAKGRPSSSVYGGNIYVTVESTDDTKIIAQMVNQFKTCGGTITFNKGEEEAKMKELKWENGYIIHYDESLDIVGREPMQISFVVSAEKITVEGAEVDHKWPK